MKTLGIHADRFFYEAKEKTSAGAERIAEPSGGYDGDCIVVFVAAEKGDERNPRSVAEQVAADTVRRAKELGCNRVVVYPYVHLTQSPSRPRTALVILRTVEELVAEECEVLRSPFGWYKRFELECKGHPLSEWSGQFAPTGAAAVEESERKAETPRSRFSRYLVVDREGNQFAITADTYEDCPLFRSDEAAYRRLHRFVANEFGHGADTGEVPRHVVYMRRHELLDYCDVAEKGHYKWYPKGLLIQHLMLDYGRNLARRWGAFEMRNPILIRGDHNVVGELMGEFHERDYHVDGGRGICYLRYASDPLGFPFLQDVRFSYKQSPLKVYEEASCFRNELEGEVSGLKRVRGFLMTDMHAACATEEEAEREFSILCERFGQLMNDVIAQGRWVLGWEGTEQFFERKREYLIGIGVRLGVPAFFKLMPEMTHYYAMKNEYQSITQDGSNIQVSTVQWDVKDGERFNIGYIDDHGVKRPCPVILHASSFGSIERALCSILENIAIDEDGGIPPTFPLWLSPTQVRFINVSDEHLEMAAELSARANAQGVRADLDDRNATVGKKIRDGESDWVPYLVVVGQREKESGQLAVRCRREREQKTLTLRELIALVRERSDGMPFRSLPLPERLTQRPIFVGG